jgi:putative oxidoreductase
MTVLQGWKALIVRLNAVGDWLPALLFRATMAWEFWESGLEKLHGENWFDSVQMSFPFPFSIIPAGISWHIATWFELIGAAMLLLGLGTRFFAFSLLFLTFVATAAVHWPDMWMMLSELAQGYSVTDHGHGNFKLPLLFVVMLVPLIFSGAGPVSLDALCERLFGHDLRLQRAPDGYALALACALFSLPFMMLTPKFGFALVAAGLAIAAVTFARLKSKR